MDIKKIFRKRTRKVGLVLSGGGIRGVGHLGAIKALEEHGYRPAVISGCSAGAIIGAFYAAGYSVDKMLNILEKNELFPATSFRLRASGFINTGFLSKLFHEYLPENTFESLKIPLYVATTNLTAGKTEYLHRGKLDEALLASSGIPMMFPATLMNDDAYYDGGVLDNLPVQPIRKQCDFLIGVHVNALDTLSSATLPPVKTLDRVIHLAIGQSVKHSANQCDLYLEPPEMLQFGLLGKKDIMSIYEHVYAYTADYLAKR